MKYSRTKFLLSAALVVAGQLSATAADIKRDSTKLHDMIAHSELMSSLEPTYLKVVVVGSPWSRNWFVSASAGTSAFIGTPLGCEDLFGRLMPAVQVSAGKWFTPHIGVRATYQGWQFKDAAIEKQEYHAAHGELLWNIVSPSTKDELGLSRWTVAPYVGGGIIHHEANGNVPFTLNYGVMAVYRFGQRVSVNMELAGLNTFQDFDGQGKSRRFGDQMYTLTAGLTINIGKVGWRRAVDANPYRRQNEYLMDYVNSLLSKNKNELAESLRDKNHNMNGDYSGLASLRARLAGQNEDGNGASTNDAVAGQTSDGKKLIGVPYYLFFNINSCELTDESQLQNLISLAKVAKAYNLMVYVEGAADSATGTEAINTSLSEARANYIARLLREQGVAEDFIRITAKGGIDKFTPVQRNRHTRVMIKK